MIIVLLHHSHHGVHRIARCCTARSFISSCALTIPVVLAGISRASGNRWAATIITGIYTVFLLGMEWILPLFPAQPKLGPVYHPVTQFIPPDFPLLLIVPALVLDFLWQKLENQTRWVQSVIAGTAFLAVLHSSGMALRRFPAVPSRAQLVFRIHLFRLPDLAGHRPFSEPLRAVPERNQILEPASLGVGSLNPDDTPRCRVG